MNVVANVLGAEFNMAQPPIRKREREWGEGRSPPLSPIPSASVPPPLDWPDYFPPQTGPIDVAKFDLPQPKASLEWWYYNTHLTGVPVNATAATAPRTFSLFASFFRQVDLGSVTEEDAAAGKPHDFYDACTWALVDVDREKYYADSALDHRSHQVLMDKLDPKVVNRKLSHAEIALREMCTKGRLPRPDRCLKRHAVISKSALSLNLDDECVVTSEPYNAAKHGPQPHGSLATVYHVKLHNPLRGIRADLTFVPQRPVSRHGVHGIVNHMMYYYCPRMAVSGELATEDGTVFKVSGSGWYDREFGGKRDDDGKDALDAWTWFSLQLDDDTEFTLFNIVDRETLVEKEKVAVLTDGKGGRIPIHDVQISYEKLWTSMTTYMEYPMQWKLFVPELQLDLRVKAAFSAQEFATVLVQGGGFYEGRVTVTGSRQGKAVSGKGFIERKNHTTFTDTEGLLKNVGRFVRQKLAEMYPLEPPSKQWMDKYVLGRNATAGTDLQKVCDTLFKPVRALTDRGGKSWRSLILVSSMNALSKDYVDCSRYIALSELLHVGSLIIDDIQDESVVRRGGKCVHIDYGVATAINAGCGSYFMAASLSGIDDHPPAVQLQLYNLYFDALRAGHAGQGLDIAGLDHLMPHAVESGEVGHLLDSLRSIHIYKTGGAAGTLCRMACVLTGASTEQANALENFGVQVGLAFQIVDDALNLKGFEGDLKEAGEDIRDGKVTYPVIKALGRLTKADREYVWTILQEHTGDRGKVQSVIDKLKSVAAIEDCLVEARNLIEDAWEPVDRTLPDSLSKLMMRAFCSYLTERTY